MRYADLMRNLGKGISDRPIAIETMPEEKQEIQKYVPRQEAVISQDAKRYGSIETTKKPIPETPAKSYRQPTSRRREIPKGYVEEGVSILSSAWSGCVSYVSSLFKWDHRKREETYFPPSQEHEDSDSVLAELAEVNIPPAPEPENSSDVLLANKMPEAPIKNANQNQDIHQEDGESIKHRMEGSNYFGLTEDDINKLRLVIERVDDIYGMLQRGERKGRETEYVKKIGIGVGIIGKVLRNYIAEVRETRSTIEGSKRADARIEKSQKEVLEKLDDMKRLSMDKLAVEDLTVEEIGEGKVVVSESGEISFDQERLEKLFATEAVNTRRLLLQAVNDVASRSSIDYQRIGSMVYAAMQLYGGQREAKMIGGKQEKPEFRADVDIDFETIGKQFIQDMAGVGQVKNELSMLSKRLEASEEERRETSKSLIKIGALIRSIDIASGERGKKIVSDVQGAVGGDVTKALRDLDAQRSRAIGELVKRFDGYMSGINTGLEALRGDMRGISERLAELESRTGQPKTAYSAGIIGDMKLAPKPTQALPIKKGKADVWNMSDDVKLTAAVECVRLFPDLVPRRRKAEEFIAELQADGNNVNYFLLDVEKKKGRDRLNNIHHHMS